MTNLRQMAEEYRRQTLDEGIAIGMAEGMTQGLTQGVAPLVRQLVRKLGRALTADEHAALCEKLAVVGPERLGDAVLDLAGDDLARWLTEPAAQ